MDAAALVRRTAVGLDGNARAGRIGYDGDELVALLEEPTFAEKSIIRLDSARVSVCVSVCACVFFRSSFTLNFAHRTLTASRTTLTLRASYCSFPSRRTMRFVRPVISATASGPPSSSMRWSSGLWGRVILSSLLRTDSYSSTSSGMRSRLTKNSSPRKKLVVT